MSYEAILYETRGPVAIITLNRPDRLNAIGQAVREEVHAAVQAAHADDAVRAAIITGAGRGFCSGADLSGAAARAAGGGVPSPVAQGEKLDETGWVGRWARRFAHFDKPLIAAVNGVAAGAGANIALACDLVVAARSASFVQAFAKLGLVPDSGGTWFLPRLVGTARALGLAFLGEKLPAEQAAAWGLIWRCVPDEELATVVDDLAKQFAAAPTRGLARTKQAIYEGFSRTLAAQLDVERDYQGELGRSSDYAEGVAAFSEKRTPRFTGR